MAAGATAVAPAQAAEVVSSNVVGYSKLTMKADGYTLIANPFVEVGTGDNIAINDMFAEDTDVANAGSSYTQADTIEVWAGDRYVTYFLFTRNGSTPAWMKVGDRTPTVEEIPVGAGAFYHNYSADSDVTLTISGEVKSEPETLTITPGYTLVKNPFPTELEFSVFAVEGATAGASYTQADTIEVWAGDRYVTYFLFTRNGSAPAWMKVGDRTPTQDKLKPYEGFFYHAIGNNSFTVTIKSPLASSGE